MLKEFKEFINRGNVVDMAVGVIIGGAFGKVITSIVNDLIMPLIGLILGGVDFTGLYIALDGGEYANIQAAEEAGAALFKYGAFIQSAIDFLIISFCIFLIVRAIMNMKEKRAAEAAKKEAAQPTTKTCPLCKTEIDIGAVKCPHCTGDLINVE